MLASAADVTDDVIETLRNVLSYLSLSQVDCTGYGQYWVRILPSSKLLRYLQKSDRDKKLKMVQPGNIYTVYGDEAR